MSSIMSDMKDYAHKLQHGDYARILLLNASERLTEMLEEKAQGFRQRNAIAEKFKVCPVCRGDRSLDSAYSSRGKACLNCDGKGTWEAFQWVLQGNRNAASETTPPPQDDAHVADGCRLFSDPAKLKESQDDPRPPSPPKGQPEWA